MSATPGSSPSREGLSALSLGLCLSVVSALLMVWLTHEVIAGEALGFDDAVRAQVRDRQVWLLPLMKLCTTLGSPGALALVSLLLFVVLYAQGRRVEDGLLVVSMAGAALLVMAMKTFFRRPRPVPFYGLAVPASWSYPSGHATASLCFFAALAIIGTGRVSGRWRVVVWSACGGAALLVGVSRVYLGVHWPSDVLGGWLTGTIWMTSVWVAFRRMRAASVTHDEAANVGIGSGRTGVSEE